MRQKVRRNCKYLLFALKGRNEQPVKWKYKNNNQNRHTGVDKQPLKYFFAGCYLII
jgi:hypothetical protein